LGDGTPARWEASSSQKRELISRQHKKTLWLQSVLTRKVPYGKYGLYVPSVTTHPYDVINAICGRKAEN
jgi:hypothetical protein